MTARKIPAAASVVVIGGGVIGASAAFHLSEAGVSDIVLIERDELASGSTSRAAGGVRAMFADDLNIKLGQRSLEAFARFGSRPGQDIDLHRNGYVFLLSSRDDVRLFEDSVALQNELGVRSRMIDPSEVAALCPGVVTDDLVAGAFSPDDGHCSPELVVFGYANAARQQGVRIERGCEVVSIDTRGEHIDAVVTTAGRIRTHAVVCAAGAWSPQIGAMVGVHLPVTPLRRQIMVTAPVERRAQLPMTIDFASTLYFHSEGPGMLVGIADPDETPGLKLEPSDDWLPLVNRAITTRIPWLLDVGIHARWAGVYEVTPDNNALIGELHDVHRFLYATGFSGHGFLQGPAVGEVLRDLYLGTSPVIDVSPLSAERFQLGRLRRETHCV